MAGRIRSAVRVEAAGAAGGLGAGSAGKDLLPGCWAGRRKRGKAKGRHQHGFKVKLARTRRAISPAELAGRRVVSPEGPQRPYRTNRGIYYVRVGSSKRQATREEPRRHQPGQKSTPETIPGNRFGSNQPEL
ncbi:MAG: hypothetical protein AB1556_16000 [Bacillota bacterium]